MEDGRETPSEQHSADSKPQTTPLVVVADNSPGDVARARAKSWTARLRKSGANPRKTLANVLIALRHAPEWHKALSYNASSLVILAARPLPWETSRKKAELPDYPRVWTDEDEILATEWMQLKGIEVPINVVSHGVQAVAKKNCFHPIREYLTGLQWDGTERVAKWLHVYLGADDTPYHESIGQRWLISAIARVMRIGETKADCMLILEGAQGLGKSTALRELASNAWFTEIYEISGKDAAMVLAGKWIIEFPELGAFKGASLEHLKAFLSASMDRFRPPYGRRAADNERQCVFAGTTNNYESLRDPSGNRRFWPVRCSAINTGQIKRDRDQLWAEAKHLYETGHPWWLETLELQAAADKEAGFRYENDPLEPEIRTHLEGRSEIVLTELVSTVLEKETKDLSRQDLARIAQILHHLGYARTQQWKAGEGRGKRIFKKVNDPKDSS